MAKLVATLASTHHPFYLKATTAASEDQIPQAAEWKRKIEAYRETLTRAEPDILVMIGSDHFHQIFLDNYPQFLIGKAPAYDATFYNEEREFGLPRYRLSGDEDLPRFLHQSLLDQNFDFAFSNELKIDHSIVCPIITLRPQNDLPIVPIYTNIFAPPLPAPRRFFDLGRAIRRAIEAYPSDKKIAAIGTGHLSLELGGPRQFMETGPDPAFDRQAIEWLRTGDADAILGSVTHASLDRSGNATHGFLNFILMLGVAGPEEADYADHLDLFHTMEAYFTWYPEGFAQ
ncbi:protocatechuate 4,5-dioxygenase beta chain [Neorhizobium galegae]|uniref:DODA-type extradiol aromatic ring-opening family dioxygenase n=1 Tax=Neorhizobium galegae TaxID=399 RepID=UPI001AE46085|nr:extradiol ring-cleavage dioxygenase [Neorhizobium galegae]MBP2551566.1 protocatechuate 4,5-dioxygenase beta chain [Neorhizobium galegae]